MSSTDDFLDDTDFVEVNQKNFQQIANKATKIGYSDGVIEGRESIFQQEFDQGYKDGFAKAFKLEKFRSFFQNLKYSDKIENTDLMKEKDEFFKIAIKQLNSLQIKDGNLDLESLDYLKETLDQFEQKMPVSSNLLK